MSGIRPCPPKNHAELSREWDRLAKERHRQIASGEDLSFEHVVVPTIWHLFGDSDRTAVLDVGSGTGDFTLQLAQIARTVKAIEPSRISMSLAREVCRTAQNIEFIEESLEESTSSLGKASATAAVAVMTLMTVPDLRGFAKSLATLLQTGAHLVAMLTHPWFWPRYWGYEQEPWFRYEVETFVEAPFVISRCRTGVRTTHIHRPLAQYVSVFAEEGFQLTTLVEPMPSTEVQALYPAPWQFPRFIGLRWAKVA